MKKSLPQLLLLCAALLCQLTLFAKDFNRNSPGASFTQAGCTQTNECFAFTYKGFQVSLDGQKVTLSFSIKTNCNRDLSYAAFELPANGTATRTGSSKYKYTTTITNNPFRSIKYEGVGIDGYKNGVSDNFSYVMSKADFDKLTTIRVQAKAATTVGTVSFNKVCAETECTVSDAALSNIKYYVGGNTFTNLQTAVAQGKPIKVCLTVAPSQGNSTYSFVSYKAPYPFFVRAEAHKQVLFDYETIVVGPQGGTFCMEIAVPDCYFQVDLVKGCIIVQFGPANTNPNNFYGRQNRLLSGAEGGTVACVPDETTGNEGCTPGYWKQEHHFGSWAPSVPTGASATKFFDVFTVCDQAGNNCSYQGLPADLTLLQALGLNGGGFNALARHAAAAYLNASSTSVAYSIKQMDLVMNVIKAFKTGNSGYKSKLETANEQNCPLGRSTLTTSAVQASDRTASLDESNTLVAAPNPFNSRTTIRFALRQEAQYTLSLFDAQGKLVRKLGSGFGKAGQQLQVNLDAAGLKEGLYMVQMANGTHLKSVKVLLKQ